MDAEEDHNSLYISIDTGTDSDEEQDSRVSNKEVRPISLSALVFA